MSDMITKKPDEKYCRSCGAIIKAEAEICPKCGVNLKRAAFIGENKDEKYCTSCGSIIKSAAEICPKCGIRQQNPVVSENKSSDELKITNVGFSIGCGVAISIIFSVFVGWIYFLIISSINPNEPSFKKGRNITGILCLIVIGIIVLVLLIAGSAILQYL